MLIYLFYTYLFYTHIKWAFSLKNYFGFFFPWARRGTGKNKMKTLKKKIVIIYRQFATPSTVYFMAFSRLILEWVAVPFSTGSSQSRIEPRCPALQADSFPAEPPGKPKNTGMGSLSLFQMTFLTQELNWGLLHCRQMSFYQLSYQGSPNYYEF